MKKLKLMLLIGCIVLLGASLLACNGSNEEGMDLIINEENGAESDFTQGQENGEESDSILEQGDETELEIIELGDDIYSFTIKVDGVVYSLPIPFSELIENGWVPEELNEEELLPKGKTWFYNVYNNEGHNFRVRFFNNTVDVINLDESEIMAFEFCYFHGGLGEIDFVFPRGITRDSSPEEIIEMYGEPTRRHEGRICFSLFYETRVSSHVGFRFDKETNELLSVTMQNPTRREISPEFQGGIPDIILDYVPPNELGEDWKTSILRIDDDLFQLPAPVMAFLEKGWEIVEDPNEIVAAQSLGPRLNIRKNNQEIRIRVHNYADTGQPIVHTSVVEIQQRFDGYFFWIELPGGITKESTLGEVIAILGEPVERSELSANVKYTFRYGQRRDSREVIIYTCNEDQRITRMIVRNNPRTLP